MAKGKDVLVIGDFTVPKITSYKVDQDKLYAADSGRDLAGVNHATLIGIYPKIEVSVGQYNKSQMQSFLKAVNKYPLTIKWYDAEDDKMRSGEEYYINDYSIELIDTINMNYKEFSFNLIPNKKKS